jgi:hypothetical protein
MFPNGSGSLASINESSKAWGMGAGRARTPLKVARVRRRIVNDALVNWILKSMMICQTFVMDEIIGCESDQLMGNTFLCAEEHYILLTSG